MKLTPSPASCARWRPAGLTRGMPDGGRRHAAYGGGGDGHRPARRGRNGAGRLARGLAIVDGERSNPRTGFLQAVSAALYLGSDVNAVNPAGDTAGHRLGAGPRHRRQAPGRARGRPQHSQFQGRPLARWWTRPKAPKFLCDCRVRKQPILLRSLGADLILHPLHHVWPVVGSARCCRSD